LELPDYRSLVSLLSKSDGSQGRATLPAGLDNAIRDAGASHSPPASEE
jgi:hypothetical protein